MRPNSPMTDPGRRAARVQYLYLIRRQDDCVVLGNRGHALNGDKAERLFPGRRAAVPAALHRVMA